MIKLWLVARYEYARNVFKRSFILALLSVPLMIGLIALIGIIMESRNVNNLPVGYVDHAGIFADPIGAPVGGSRKPVTFIPYRLEDDARIALEAREIQAYYVVAPDYPDTRKIGLFYLEKPGSNATRQFTDFVQINLLADHPREIALRAAGGTAVTVRSFDGTREIPGGGPTLGMLLPLLVGAAFLFLLLMASGYLMQAMADEKENRTMEVLVTSVSPQQLVSGKVLGIVGISLTQLLTWTSIGALAAVIAVGTGVGWFQDLRLDWRPVVAAVALAVPSYVLACAVMTTIGATVTSGREGTSISALFFILHMAPLYVAWTFVETPNAPLPLVLSMLPFTALMTISMRNMFTVVPMWQVGASVTIQILWAAGAVWLAGRAIRLGMLRYGQRLRWGELMKARYR